MRRDFVLLPSKSHDKDFLAKKKRSGMLTGKRILTIGFIITFFCISLTKHLIPSLEDVQDSLDSATSPPSTETRSPPSTEELLKQYNICRATWEAGYVCKGPEYDEFADKLEALLLDQEQTRRPNSSAPMFALERKPPLWGKRPHAPFPANASILALGNSFTRQIFHALSCEYSTLQHIDVEANSESPMRRGTYYFIEFANHAKLHLVTNSAIFYSKQWLRYLKEMIKCDSLQDFDALVVGKLNNYADAYNTTFMELMIEKTAALEDADFSTNPPPTLVDFAEQYQGPIVIHSPFKTPDSVPEILSMITQVGRKNVRLVKLREYVPFLGECSTDNWQSVGVCGDNQMAHRCIGERGGHPDLASWDIIEALHDLLGP